MATKRTKSDRGVELNEPVALILQQLLSEFDEHGRTIDDLRNQYEGPSTKELKSRLIAQGFSDVEYEIAMSDLDNNDMIKTGPMDLTEAISTGGVLILPMIYSRKDYAYLKEKGYKEAKRISGKPTAGQKSPSNRDGTTVHGDQYINYGQAGAIGPNSTGSIHYQQQWTAIQSDVDLNALTSELEQLRKHLQQSASSSSDYQRLALLSEAEELAKKRDGGRAMEVLSKVGKGALGVAKDIGTEIAAKVIAQSMGLAP